MMRLAFWNIQGFNTPLKQVNVCKLLRKHRVHIFAVIECRMQGSKVDQLMHRRMPGWKQFNNFELYQPGRIITFWDPMIMDVQLLDKCEQAIHLLVNCKVTSTTFLLTVIYGFNSLVGRRNLWDFLIRRQPADQQPWLIMGDFNSMLYEDDKLNGNAVSAYETRDFLNCILSTGFSDVASVGERYTWTNREVWSKLDRVMVNNQWDQRINAHFLPFHEVSDHVPCLVNIGEGNQNRRPSFKYFDMWADHQDFHNVVHQTWNTSLYGTFQYRVCKKLKALKAPLKELNRQHFQHISARVETAQGKLQQLMAALQEEPSNRQLQSEVKEQRRDTIRLAEAERKYLFQKLKCKYLLEADRNTKLFHALVKRKAKMHCIPAITREDGTLTHAESEVGDEFRKYYTHLLGTSSDGQQLQQDVFNLGQNITAEQSVLLTLPITSDLVRKTLLTIANDKSPGPDGFTAGFFKSAWHIVGEEITMAVQEFFATGKLLKQLNHTMVALIPKSKHANMLGDYRPISCCNVLYKLISKILASRFAQVLPNIIDEAQSAFVSDRSMIENIHLAQELMKGYNRKRISPRCLIKVDFRKAYDSVDWQFLRQVLIGMRFPELFVTWTMECVTTASYSIRVNGDSYGFFPGRKGLRQGDPISPYLFVLCMEYFTRLMKRYTADHPFNYHPRCGNLKITHLSYADDLMIFTRGDAPSVKQVWDCLTEFGRMSGLEANNHKTHIFMAGIPTQDQQEILSITQVQQGELPIRYLGVPLAGEGLRVQHYAPLIAKVAEQISMWSAASLSHAGRLELIKSVLQGIHCFWLSVLPVPAGVIDRVIGMCRKFLWNNGKPMIAWKQLVMPKQEGGLGLRDLSAWNKALLTKVLWKIQHKKDTLWVRWMHHIYLQRTDIWNLITHRDQSPLLRSLITIRDICILKEGGPQEARQKIEAWRYEDLASQAYHYFRHHEPAVAWYTVVWNSYIPPKYSFTMWQAIKGRLLTRDQLGFLDIDQSCGLCGHPQETTPHLYFRCSFSRQLWTRIAGWSGIGTRDMDLQEIIRRIKRHARGTTWPSRKRRIAFACTIYYIWLTRNRLYFEHLQPNVDDIVMRIKTQVYKIGYHLYPNVSILY
ncbi:MAG: hypothetical protein CPSOU_6785 [uncultured Paraburkholderia sp.]|nr:MAG: hypothetical protein CPSOU_6785 [uncultured Paraburkholderia sp.]